MAALAIVPAMTSPAETDRRLGDLLRYGTVCEVAGAHCRVKLDEGFETDWIKMPMIRAGSIRIWAPFANGEEVSLVCPDGDIAAATIHASHASDDYPAPLDPAQTRIDWADGSWIGYDPGAGDFTVQLVAGAVRLVAPGGLAIDADVEVRGKLHATAEISSDIDLTASGVSLVDHDHVETGALTKKPRRQ
ncbi:phage baseplate assembly protein V [Caulobacter segnis]|uniref:Phage baseplate assembly protein V n=1 Tax=Caulobacter segnis TaxID=88688 RepID=A0A2W5VH06_9CAUL|nr:phage baseplate assembly protein V [Caulobacter segnis]PZR37183.1 MAG: phage baseplate assembly protein V [Caulobacter segnis]